MEASMGNPQIPPVLEFRVREVTRYVVTGYSRYDGDPETAHLDPGRAWTICEGPNLDYANEIAETYAKANPGAKVFPIPPHASDCAVHNEPAYVAEACDCRDKAE
jgi:hypothetical protein